MDGCRLKRNQSSRSGMKDGKKKNPNNYSGNTVVSLNTYQRYDHYGSSSENNRGSRYHIMDGY